MNLEELNQLLDEQIIHFLQRKGILPTTRCCTGCGRELVLKKRKQTKDGYTYRCNSKNCSKEWFGLKKGTFFEKQKLTLSQVLLLILLKSQETSITIASRLTNISMRSVCDIYFLLRDKLYTFFQRNLVQLGSEERIVQVDESNSD